MIHKFVALLRGINVGGHRIIKMDALKNVLKLLHLKNIETYLQTGNIIFESEITSVDKLREQIHAIVLQNFGLDIPIQVISADDFLSIYKKNPFLKDKTLDIKKSFVVFMNQIPEKEIFEMIQSNKSYPEKMVLLDKVIYIYYPNGCGKTKVGNNFLEKKLKVSATTRNLNTVIHLQEKLSFKDSN